MSGQRGRPQRLNVFGPCFAPYINDINKVSISSAAGGMERGWVWGGGGKGIHAESHMTSGDKRKGNKSWMGTSGARKYHSKLAAGLVCCYFINPTASRKIKSGVTTFRDKA